MKSSSKSERERESVSWRSPFIVRKLDRKWCVLERLDSGVAVTSFWDTRDEAREAAGQLNQEERRGRR